LHLCLDGSRGEHVHLQISRRDVRPRLALEQGAALLILRTVHISSPADYARLYSDAKFRIDASVGYYHYVEEATSRLVSAGATPRILMLVREPVSWARSLHMENLYQCIETHPRLEDCLAEDRSDPTLWWQLRYADVRYLEVFELLAASFARIMVLDYDDFRADVADSMRAICRFLELDIVAPFSEKVHHSSRERMNLHRFGRLRPVSARLPLSVSRPIANLLSRLPATRRHSENLEFIQERMTDSIASFDALKRRLSSAPKEMQARA
jgi:hypothetical protein